MQSAARRLRELADDRGLQIVQNGHGSTIVRASADLGPLCDGSLFSRATDLEEAEIELIAAATTTPPREAVTATKLGGVRQ